MLGAALAVGACGDDGREGVKGYIERANAIQEQAAPEFERAQRVYIRFSKGKLPPRVAADRLAGAEQTIRSARADIAELDPPSDAAGLHRSLLHVYDLNAGLAEETTQLGRYLPAFAEALEPLEAAGRRLRAGLSDSSDAAAQEEAFGAYAEALDAVVGDLEALEPPPLLASSHRAQVRRLSRTRTLARGLETAIGEQDSKEVARLLLRFRRLNSRAGRVGLPPEAVRAYNERVRAVTEAESAVRREQRELNAKFE